MFTGIIQALGHVKSLEDGVLQVDPKGQIDLETVEMGESIAVNGCCLTAVPGADAGCLRFDLSPETIARTSFQSIAAGSVVNLERAMLATSRFGGHIVSGHVDALGKVVGIQPEGNSTIFTFEVPEGAERYLIDKGSICIDGISLTVVSPEANRFSVWVIPHTIAHTNLSGHSVGAVVNLEYDVVAKYLEKLSGAYRSLD